MKLQITIDGKAYEVEVEVLEDEESPQQAPAPVYQPFYPTLAPAPAAAKAQGPVNPWSADGKTCLSPVMGLAIKVNVAPGQAVAAGELILVLEAMKMETNLTAPGAGTVKAVHVKAGDSVKISQVLVEFE